MTCLDVQEPLGSDCGDEFLCESCLVGRETGEVDGGQVGPGKLELGLGDVLEGGEGNWGWH